MSRKLKTTTIVILTTVCVAVLVFEVRHQYGEHVIRKEQQQISDSQLSYFNSFLKPGMMRDEVHMELQKRSISAVEFHDSPGTAKEYVLLKRFRSPAWYCNFEDLRLLMEFAPSTDGIFLHDQLSRIDISRQLEQCL